MKIVMFSINPLFSDTVMGGAPKHLQNIAIYMGERGHDVTVLCTQTETHAGAFKLQENVTVKPILPFKQPFPQPYAVPAYDMARILQIVAEHLQSADRFYMHDGEFLFPYAYQSVPTVVSLRDNVYPETLLGGFLFQGHNLVLISEYSRQYFEQTVGQFFPEFSGRITVIHNGLDWNKFKPTQPEDIFEYIAIEPDHNRPVLLHPHRPEESKGIMQTIELVNKLVNEYGIDDLIALAPRWHEVQSSSALNEFYERIALKIDEYGLKDNFVFHGWIPQELMPQYYSLGSITVSLGYFPESFGNAVYESLGCGTPSIVARISTHRELLPDTLIDKVDYDDIDTAAQIANDIIYHKRRTSGETLNYLHQYYGIDRQLHAYATTIENAELVTPLQYHPLEITENTTFALPVWCYLSEARGIYHDFKANYRNDGHLIDLLKQYPESFTRADAQTIGITSEQFEILYREGYIVPKVI